MSKHNMQKKTKQVQWKLWNIQRRWRKSHKGAWCGVINKDNEKVTDIDIKALLKKHQLLLWNYQNINIIGRISNKASDKETECSGNLWVEKALREDIDPDDKVTKILIKEVLGNYNALVNEDKDQWNSEKMASNDPSISHYQD